MPQADQHTIFIAERDDAVRSSMTALFCTSGFAVGAFSCGKDLMEAVRQCRPDGAIINLNLPDMSGLELLDKLLETDAYLPVIMMGGLVAVPLVVKAIQHGALDVIEKPFRPDQLITLLNNACAKKCPKAPSSNISRSIHFDTLTIRQKQVLKHLVAGRQNKNIAFDLGISVRTVEVHRARMMKHLRVKNLTELLKLAIDAGATKH